MLIEHIFLFLIGGSIAGFIDSIAGGGGLITLPLLSLVLSPGIEAVASNKIVGTVGSFVALCVYTRNRKLNWRQGFLFVANIMLGSYAGSLIAPHLPSSWLRWFLIAACPLLLIIIWKKDQWTKLAENFHDNETHDPLWHLRVIGAGLACGIYDGAFGPGGGTFMFLALIYFLQLPLFSALAISKLANTASAFTSLLSYANQGYVHWYIGGMLAIGMGLGALLGSITNLQKAGKFMQPALALVVFLLLAQLLRDSGISF